MARRLYFLKNRPWERRSVAGSGTKNPQRTVRRGLARFIFNLYLCISE